MPKKGKEIILPFWIGLTPRPRIYDEGSITLYKRHTSVHDGSTQFPVGLAVVDGLVVVIGSLYKEVAKTTSETETNLD